MTVWQYAQLRVAYDNRSAAGDGRWMLAWHGPDATTQASADAYGGVVAELNRAGAQGWELVNVAALGAEDSGRFPDHGDWSLTRYTFRRPHDRAVATRAEFIQQGESAGSQLIGTGKPAVQDGLPAEPRSAESAAVRLTVYFQRDGERAGIDDRGVRPDAGRLLIRRQAAPLPSQADIDEIESLRARYHTPGISRERREKIKDAAAEYAASWMEGQLGTAWWKTQESFPLSHAADLLDGSAEWLRDQVEHPFADAASAAGAKGPAVSVGDGITTNFVTAPVTRPPRSAAFVCEVTGIVIGSATGAHPLVIACAKRLAHDVLGDVIERIIDSIGPDSRRTAGDPLPDHKVQGKTPEELRNIFDVDKEKNLSLRARNQPSQPGTQRDTTEPAVLLPPDI